MRNIALKVLLLIGGVLVTLWFAIDYGIYAIILAWFMSIRETAFLLGQTYFFRQVLRPFSKRLTEGLIVLLFGRATLGRKKARLIQIISERIELVLTIWRRLPEMMHIILIVGILSVIALSDYTLYLLVFAVPIGRYLFKVLHYCGIDFPYDQWVRIPRRRVRRYLRTNKVLRITRHPWRVFIYCILKRFETERELRNNKAPLS